MTHRRAHDELEARLAEVQRAIDDGRAGRAAELRAAAAKLRAGDENARNELRRLAHRVRGVLGERDDAIAREALRLERDAEHDAERIASAHRLAELLEAPPTPPSTPQNEPAEGSPEGPATAGLRVLALDDDEATRRLLTLTLVRVGRCQAVVLDDPRAALAHVREAELDLVIVDAMMPDTTGLELYASIRRERGASLPIAFLSAASADELGWDLSHDPHAVWLRKPFRPPRLIEQLGAFVRRTR